MRKLVCLGASNPETIRVVNAVNENDNDFEFLGFVDNDEKKWGTSFCGYPVFGGMSEVKRLSREGAQFCNLITRDCITRYETTKELVNCGARLTNLIHPNVNLEMVDVGSGNYIQESAILQAEVRVGNNSAIHFGAHIGHETSIGNSVFVAGGCHISGLVEINDGVFIGTGAIIVPRVKIGKWSLIGAGATVAKDVPPYKVVVGNPATSVKALDQIYDSGNVL